MRKRILLIVESVCGIGLVMVGGYLLHSGLLISGTCSGLMSLCFGLYVLRTIIRDWGR